MNDVLVTSSFNFTELESQHCLACCHFISIFARLAACRLKNSNWRGSLHNVMLFYSRESIEVGAGHDCRSHGDRVRLYIPILS